jgi:hypothetical protein
MSGKLRLKKNMKGRNGEPASGEMREQIKRLENRGEALNSRE